jgi:hypothetical protein
MQLLCAMQCKAADGWHCIHAIAHPVAAPRRAHPRSQTRRYLSVYDRKVKVTQQSGQVSGVCASSCWLADAARFALTGV